MANTAGLGEVAGSISAPLVVVTGGRIVRQREGETAIGITVGVPVNLDVTDMTIHEADYVAVWFESGSKREAIDSSFNHRHTS